MEGPADSLFPVVQKYFYPEDEEQRGRLCKQQGVQQCTYSLLTPVTRDCWAVCVCVFEEAGRDHLVLEDLGLMKQIQHQHQLSGTRHLQSYACDADSKSPEAAATV